jgi:protein gp37
MHLERLNYPAMRKKASTIFICSMGELFGPWVPEKWINLVLDMTAEYKCKQHLFFFLTKYPERYEEFAFGNNCFLGTSISNNNDVHRVNTLREMAMAGGNTSFVSIEPLHGPVNEINFTGIDWLIIGAETGHNATDYKRPWVVDVLMRKANTPVLLKDNLHWDVQIRDLPRVDHPAMINLRKSWK